MVKSMAWYNIYGECSIYIGQMFVNFCFEVWENYLFENYLLFEKW